MAASYPSDTDVVASATAAIAEIGRHVDHQSKDAESVDTKAAALLTVSVAGGTLAVSRTLAVDTDPRLLSAVVAGIVAIALVVSLFQALRPRGPFSYGPDPRQLGALIDRETNKAVLLSMTDAFVKSRENNVVFLEAKQGWYQRALRCLVAIGVAVGWMTQTGAIK
jgi:hypothetical protein